MGRKRSESPVSTASVVRERKSTGLPEGGWGPPVANLIHVGSTYRPGINI